MCMSPLEHVKGGVLVIYVVFPCMMHYGTLVWGLSHIVMSATNAPDPIVEVKYNKVDTPS